MNPRSSGRVKLIWKNQNQNQSTVHVQLTLKTTLYYKVVRFSYLRILGDCLKLQLKIKIIAMPLVCTGDGMRDLQSAEYKQKILSYSSPHCSYSVIILAYLIFFWKLIVCLCKTMCYLANSVHKTFEELDTSVCCHFFYSGR